MHPNYQVHIRQREPKNTQQVDAQVVKGPKNKQFIKSLRNSC